MNLDSLIKKKASRNKTAKKLILIKRSLPKTLTLKVAQIPIAKAQEKILSNKVMHKYNQNQVNHLLTLILQIFKIPYRIQKTQQKCKTVRLAYNKDLRCKSYRKINKSWRPNFSSTSQTSNSRQKKRQTKKRLLKEFNRRNTL